MSFFIDTGTSKHKWLRGVRPASSQLKWGTEVGKISFHKCADVNITEGGCSDAPASVPESFRKLLKTRKKALADPNESLPYNTSVVDTIRTVSEEPIYAKLYPYPMGVADFVYKEIQDLSRNDIIKKSASPYDNPMVRRAPMRRATATSAW